MRLSLLQAAAFVVLLLASAGCSFAQGAAEVDGISTLNRGPITVLYAPEDGGLAQSVLERAQFHHRNIREDLGLEGRIPVTILLITRNLPEGGYRNLDRTLAPWIAGAAFADRQFILLRIRPGQTVLEHDPLLAHELTHVILKADYPFMSSWPLWFQEGLAMRESRGEGLRHYVSLSLAALMDRLIPLNELRNGFPENEGASRLAYAESFSVISYLIARDGHRRFQSFMDMLREEEFEKSFLLVYGSGTGAMEKEWRQSLQRRYHWIPLLTGGTSFWVLILMLFFLSLAVRRRKDRLLRKKWEEEEREGYG